jgi:hypothetical protein
MHVRLVWGLFAVVAGAIFVTYWRLPPEEIYNVSEDGLDGAAGRVLVFLNYPVSLAAIAIAWLSAERLAASWATRAAVAATILCAVTAWPGVVDHHDLDAKPINFVPAIGVAIALWLSLRVPWEPVGRRRLDSARVAIACVFLLGAIPWLAAVLGLYAPGDLFMGEEIRRGGEGTFYAAVHLGDHEGLDGTLLVLSALLLSRLWARVALLYLMALMLVYGAAVALNDFWFEQLVKRGTTTWDVPDVLRPGLTVQWLVVIALAGLVAAAIRRLEGPPPLAGDPRRREPAPPLGGPSGGSTTDGPSP